MDLSRFSYKKNTKHPCKKDKNANYHSIKINHLLESSLPPKLNLSTIKSMNKLEKMQTVDIGEIRRNESSYNSQVTLVTEKKKQSIINESLHFIFMELPKEILALDQLLNEIRTISRSCNSIESVEVTEKTKWRNLLNNIKQANKNRNAAEENVKKKIVLDELQTTSDNILENACSCHFEPQTLSIPGDKRKLWGLEHVCSNSYTFQKVLNFYAFDNVQTNQQILKFSYKLRSLFVKLGTKFSNVELGFSLMFPKSESNEDANKSLQILEQLLTQVNNVSIDLNIFEDWLEKRAGLIKQILVNPHFGESRNLLQKFDNNVCKKFENLIKKLITQYLIFYDLFVMNIDSIVSVKNKNTSKRRSSGSPILDYNGIFS